MTSLRHLVASHRRNPGVLRTIASEVALQVGLALALGGQALALVEYKLTDPIGVAGDQFGDTVAISGDYAVIGAPENDTLGTNVGKALVFHYSGAAWTLQATLYPSAYSAQARFGASVAIDGDYVVVGAAGDGAGKAFVYSRSVASWPEQAMLTASDGASGDRFGYSVAIGGSHVLVGATNDDGQGDDSGSAYVFFRTLNIWSEQAKLLPAGGVAHDRFGHAVAISGDRVLVSRLRTQFASGGAYTFTRSGSVWTEEAAFGIPDPISSDNFGAHVSLSGGRAIIGASSHPHFPSNGAAYVYELDAANSWVLDAELRHPDLTGPPDNLGFGVAIDGDAAVVGAPLADGTIPDSGVAHLYERTLGGAWSHVRELGSTPPAANEGFGGAVSLSGDCRIVGADRALDPAPGPGAAYVYCGEAFSIAKVDFDIICCFQPPDYTTGPVEFQIAFENLTVDPAMVTYWVDLHRPDGQIDEVVAMTEVDIDAGASHLAEHAAAMDAGAPPGDYALVLYWDDANGSHSQAIGFTVGVQAVPAMPLGGLLVLSVLLMLAASWLLPRVRAVRSPRGLRCSAQERCRSGHW